MRALFFIACALLISACVRPATPHPPDPSENPRWAFSTDTNPKGVFLVVHGLNLKPSALDPLCGFLASQGFHSYRTTLRGHNEPQGKPFDVAEWQRDVVEATATIQSRFPDLPFYALGYSIGGLLLTNAFDSNSHIPTPRGMILLAPAISLRTFADIATTLSIPPPLSWSVPNLAPPAYRRYELTPIFWYANTLALYETMGSIQNATRLKKIQTLVILNPKDELVSEEGTRRWIQGHHLAPQWRVELIHPAPSDGLLKEHLIIDQTSLGASEWTHLQSLVGAFLAEIDR